MDLRNLSNKSKKNYKTKCRKRHGTTESVILPVVHSGNQVSPEHAFRESLRPSSQGGKFRRPNLNFVQNVVNPLNFQVAKDTPLPSRTDFYHMLLEAELEGIAANDEASAKDALSKSGILGRDKEFISFSKESLMGNNQILQNSIQDTVVENRITRRIQPRIATFRNARFATDNSIVAKKEQIRKYKRASIIQQLNQRSSKCTEAPNSESNQEQSEAVVKKLKNGPSHSTRRVEEMSKIGRRRQRNAENEAVRYLHEKKLVERIQAATEWKKASEMRWEYLREVVNIVHPTAARVRAIHKAGKTPKPLVTGSLHDALIDTAPFFWISKHELVRTFLAQYAYNARSRARYSFLMSQLFVALDDKLTGVMDWRDLVAMLKVIESPNQSINKKLHWMFDLYAKPFESHNDPNYQFGEPVIDLYATWKISQVAALEHEKGEAFSLLCLCVRPIWGKPCRQTSIETSKKKNEDSKGISNEAKKKIHIIDQLTTPQEERIAAARDEAKLSQGESIQDEYLRLKVLYNGKCLNRNEFHKVFIRSGVIFGSSNGTAMDYHKLLQSNKQPDNKHGKELMDGNDNTGDIKSNEQEQDVTANMQSSHQQLEIVPETNSTQHVTEDNEQTAGRQSGLFELYCVQFWNRLPESTRLEITIHGQEKASESFRVLDQRLRMQQAVDFFGSVMVPSYLQDRFAMWRSFVKQRRRMNKAQAHWELRSKRVGFSNYELWVEGRLFRREQTSLATQVCNLRILDTQFAIWKQFAVVEGKSNREKKANAIALNQRHIQLHHFHVWRRIAHEQVLDKRARNHYKATLSRLVLVEWREAAALCIFEQAEAERMGKLRQTILLADLAESKRKAEIERAAREEDERLEAEEAERQEAIRRKQAERAEQQRLEALRKIEADKKLLQQREANRQHKKAKREKEKEAFVQVWEGIAKKAVQEARSEAEIFLATPQGAKQIIREIKLIQDDVELMSSKSDEQGQTMDSADATWTKIFDPKFNEYFFYNRETGEKKEPNLLTKSECRSIACSQYIVRQVEGARNDVMVMRQREEENENMDQAARLVQGMWRSRLAKNVILQMLKSVYVKRIDAHSGKCYYYNRATKESSWMKPLTLGNDDLSLPEWVVRYKDQPGMEPVLYYENRLSPWLSTATKPPGIIPCTVCKFQLASDYCGECSEYFCLDCYEAAHQKIKAKDGPSALVSHEERHRVVDTVSALCQMCSSNQAQGMCKECGWTLACDKCFNLVHLNHYERKKHDRLLM